MKQKFETLAVHSGQTVNQNTMARGIEICRSTAFLFKSHEHAKNLFGLKELGNIYSRLTNPTNAVLEERITALEGGAASVVVASGTSAIHYTVINIAEMGDEIVASDRLYGGTYTMFSAILPQFGITTKFADINNPETFEKQITEKTRMIYLESIGNPTLDVADIKLFADMAHKHNLPLVVDATFSTPYLMRAIEHGADIVINSLTKWIGGHGSAIGGVVTDAGKFDFSDKKFALYNKPDANYHGMKWATDLPEPLAPIKFALRLRTVPLRNLGACLSADNSWIFIQGLESLSLRMERHSENALKVAKYLESHNKVEWVRYPGLEKDPSNTLAKKYLNNGFGGMVVFGIKGGLVAGGKFIELLKLFSHVANVGDAKSLAIHPASTSHSQMTEEQLISSGVKTDLVRLSIGIEHIDDILNDIKEALDQI